MERRKEYEKDEIIACPKCGNDAIYYESPSELVKCENCGLVEFKIRQEQRHRQARSNSIHVSEGVRLCPISTTD